MVVVEEVELVKDGETELHHVALLPVRKVAEKDRTGDDCGERHAICFFHEVTDHITIGVEHQVNGGADARVIQGVADEQPKLCDLLGGVRFLGEDLYHVGVVDSVYASFFAATKSIAKSEGAVIVGADGIAFLGNVADLVDLIRDARVERMVVSLKGICRGVYRAVVCRMVATLAVIVAAAGLVAVALVVATLIVAVLVEMIALEVALIAGIEHIVSLIIYEQIIKHFVIAVSITHDAFSLSVYRLL